MLWCVAAQNIIIFQWHPTWNNVSARAVVERDAAWLLTDDSTHAVVVPGGMPPMEEWPAFAGIDGAMLCRAVPSPLHIVLATTPHAMFLMVLSCAQRVTACRAVLCTPQAMFLMAWRLCKLSEVGTLTHEQASLVKAWNTLRGW